MISGGETGAEQAGWRAAEAIGVPTGGWMSKGFLTEEGPRPEFAEDTVRAEVPTDSSCSSNRAERPSTPTRRSGSA